MDSKKISSLCLILATAQSSCPAHAAASPEVCDAAAAVAAQAYEQEYGSPQDKRWAQTYDAEMRAGQVASILNEYARSFSAKDIQFIGLRKKDAIYTAGAETVIKQKYFAIREKNEWRACKPGSAWEMFADRSATLESDIRCLDLGVVKDLPVLENFISRHNTLAKAGYEWSRSERIADCKAQNTYQLQIRENLLEGQPREGFESELSDKQIRAIAEERCSETREFKPLPPISIAMSRIPGTDYLSYQFFSAIDTSELAGQLPYTLAQYPDINNVKDRQEIDLDLQGGAVWVCNGDICGSAPAVPSQPVQQAKPTAQSILAVLHAQGLKSFAEVYKPWEKYYTEKMRAISCPIKQDVLASRPEAQGSEASFAGTAIKPDQTPGRSPAGAESPANAGGATSNPDAGL